MMVTPQEVTGPINIGNPDEFTIRELAAILIERTGSKSKTLSAPLPSDDPRERQPNIAKARDLLSWETKLHLRNRLIKTISYFDNRQKQNEAWSIRSSAVR